MKRRWWIAIFLFSLNAINYIDRVALSLAAHPIAVEFKLTPVELGYLFSSFLWTYTAAQIPMGALCDRFGSKRVTGLGLALWSAATALTGSAGSILTLMASRLTMGIGEATSNPGGARVVREWFLATERGTVNAIFTSGTLAGPAISAILVAALLDWVGWRVAFVIAGALGFVWVMLWQWIYEAPERARWLSPAERNLIISGREMNRGNVTVDSSEMGLLSLLKTKAMWAMIFVQGCTAYCSYLFLFWLPSYLQVTKHLTIMRTGQLTALPYGFALVLCLIIGRLSDHLLKKYTWHAGRRRFVVAIAMVIGAAMVIAAPFVANTLLLLALLTIALAAIAGNVSQLFALLSDLLPDSRNIGKAMGIMVVGGNLCGILAPIVTGYVVSITRSYNNGFVFASALMLAGAVVSLLFASEPIEVRKSLTTTIVRADKTI